MRFRDLSRRAKAALALLTVLSPVVLFGLIEAGVRLSGVETELVPHRNVEIAIPAWLAADENFAAGLHPRAHLASRAGHARTLRAAASSRHHCLQLRGERSAEAASLGRGSARGGRRLALLRKLAYDAGSSDRYKDIPASSLVPAVSDTEYVANLRAMTRTVRAALARPVLLGVCANDTIVALMRDVGRRMQVPMVDALPLLTDRQEDLRGGRIYAAEVGYYERLYGREVMERNKYLYLSTDGCHPNRAGMSLIADALADVILK